MRNASSRRDEKIFAVKKKTQNLIDADSALTHVSESSAGDVFFCFRVSLLRILGDAAMYYGLYLFVIALVILMGQLAFALYQVASLYLS
jgi:hypothetical protein